MSRLRRPFLSDRYFFITVRLLKGRGRLRDADFRQLALALNRTRRQHPFYLTAWAFLPGAGADARFVASAISRSERNLLVFIPPDPFPSFRWPGSAFFILHHSEFIILFDPSAPFVDASLAD
jgi:hypothetical protein